VSVEDIAARHRRSPRTIRDWIKHGCMPPRAGRIVLPATLAGKRYAIDTDDLELFEARLRAYGTRPSRRIHLILCDSRSPKMPTIADHIRAHLEATGKSKRALSLEAGFGEGWVKDVLRGNSKRPGAAALARVSAIIGVDLNAIPIQRATSAADALRLLNAG
jgi:hypothetical protein